VFGGEPLFEYTYAQSFYIPEHGEPEYGNSTAEKLFVQGRGEVSEYCVIQSSQEKTFSFGECLQAEPTDETSFREAIKSDNLVAPEIILEIARIIREKTQFLELDGSNIPNYIDNEDRVDGMGMYNYRSPIIQETTDWALEQETGKSPTTGIPLDRVAVTAANIGNELISTQKKEESMPEQ
jgi:hypothetical protein